MEWINYLAPAKDVAQIFGAIGVLILGALGLGTWRRQLRGAAEYDLAKKMLTTTYRVQYAIRSVRDFRLVIAKKITPPEQQLEKERLAYKERFDHLDAVFAKLRTLALEAKAVWGERSQKPIQRLQAFIVFLQQQVEMHFWLEGAYGDPAGHIPTSPEAVADNNEFIYNNSNENKYTLLVAEIVGNVEKVCQDALGRKT